MKGKEQKVCKLVKSLYGLKQAPRAWYEKLTEHLLKLNFEHFDLDDATLFIKKVGRSVVYLVVYVDDLLMTGNKLEPNQLAASGCTRTNTDQMPHLTSTKQGL